MLVYYPEKLFQDFMFVPTFLFIMETDYNQRSQSKLGTSCFNIFINMHIKLLYIERYPAW